MGFRYRSQYFGLTGDADYDNKTQRKLSLAKKLGINILALYPEDVVRYPELRKKLEEHLTRDYSSSGTIGC